MGRNLVAWSQSVAAGESEAPRALIMYEANPLYALPPNSGMKELFAKSAFKVAMASFLSESCAQCDLVLPAAMGLERFDDCYTPYRLRRNQLEHQPSSCQALLQRAPHGRSADRAGKGVGVETGVKDMPELLYKKAYSLGANFRRQVENGSVFLKKASGAFSVPVYNAAALKTALSAKKADAALTLAPVVVLGIGTPQTGIPPFATKLIMEYQLAGPYSVAQMNAATAKKLGVRKGSQHSS